MIFLNWKSLRVITLNIVFRASWRTRSKANSWTGLWWELRRDVPLEIANLQNHQDSKWSFVQASGSLLLITFCLINLAFFNWCFVLNNQEIILYQKVCTHNKTIQLFRVWKSHKLRKIQKLSLYSKEIKRSLKPHQWTKKQKSQTKLFWSLQICWQRPRNKKREKFRTELEVLSLLILLRLVH